jgi:hypothetical protein
MNRKDVIEWAKRTNKQEYQMSPEQWEAALWGGSLKLSALCELLELCGVLEVEKQEPPSAEQPPTNTATYPSISSAMASPSDLNHEKIPGPGLNNPRSS